ncbi:MAG: hypothetical protein CM1200mP2_46500 [Planctomycetaceae bacterium]|nr:MAG: hypothetical protein CM1200mP2_46500 [Planctomycetaceae bacterium]
MWSTIATPLGWFAMLSTHLPPTVRANTSPTRSGGVVDRGGAAVVVLTLLAAPRGNGAMISISWEKAGAVFDTRTPGTEMDETRGKYL